MMSIYLGIARSGLLSPLNVVLNVIFLMVFVGFVEETCFRGYVQSRPNEVFAKGHKQLVFKAWRVNYGKGLLLASIIFGLLHVINYANPLIPKCVLTWWMPIHITGCIVVGCLFGAIRESSGDVYVSASLHGSVMTTYTFLLTYTNELIPWYQPFY
ncbi:MAG: CPBP family intramembrane glutamic endopeptidase [Nitrososphaerota archaeon]|nr:CPBP family intramembrane metalloprotease [Candidatus Nezhaarchaeota archaeon]MDW8050768.1 CPBP family intramembrane glutamic endopeptidase [Nitrososphaerota archaeon]